MRRAFPQGDLQASHLLGRISARPGDLRPGDLHPGDPRLGDLRPGDLCLGDLHLGDLRPGDLHLGDLPVGVPGGGRAGGHVTQCSCLYCSYLKSTQFNCLDLKSC